MYKGQAWVSPCVIPSRTLGCRHVRVERTHSLRVDSRGWRAHRHTAGTELAFCITGTACCVCCIREAAACVNVCRIGYTCILAWGQQRCRCLQALIHASSALTAACIPCTGGLRVEQVHTQGSSRSTCTDMCTVFGSMLPSCNKTTLRGTHGRSDQPHMPVYV